MRTFRPKPRLALIALLAIAVNLPTFGATSTCAPTPKPAPTRAARACCAPKATPAPCCCSRASTRHRSPTQTAQISCLCRSETPPVAPRREAPITKVQVSTDLDLALATVEAPLPAATPFLPTARPWAPSHVPLYLGIAHLLI